MGGNVFFCAPLRKIQVQIPQQQFQISISDVYFSSMETDVDFFNRIDSKRPLTEGKNRPE